MRNFQVWGGVAALMAAATFVLGFALVLLGAVNYGSLNTDSIKNIILLAQYKNLIHAWYFTIYVVIGVFLVIGVCALRAAKGELVSINSFDSPFV